MNLFFPTILFHIQVLLEIQIIRMEKITHKCRVLLIKFEVYLIVSIFGMILLFYLISCQVSLRLAFGASFFIRTLNFTSFFLS